ncbi:hypothetical protein GUJ93_ZPchr0012g20930 [Zizania palustris]|uniref:Uncharacterized protein n=1 Tax=Zizania palustris TaxID=103762 RepID=A0A8J5WP36_ZIZPA|nr:hypothetical protein GUJ93_ZPchr0012g20930 [Zizania palustris]KAG8092271.1 hypothetical protein GUJ93_ZPchr0012g20930 [Zizania palustris]KAG8092272.1 hypothetical protein GUJ93_ZPchr0012g20930 [Zizania palustris]
MGCAAEQAHPADLQLGCKPDRVRFWVRRSVRPWPNTRSARGARRAEPGRLAGRANKAVADWQHGGELLLLLVYSLRPPQQLVADHREPPLVRSSGRWGREPRQAGSGTLLLPSSLLTGAAPLPPSAAARFYL